MVKKQLIMEKAIELFAENGFEATSVQQITEKCGISKGAFYLHFKSKDELISSLIDHFMTDMITEIEQSVNKELATEELLYNYLLVTLGEFKHKANLAKLFLKGNGFSLNQELLEKLQMYTGVINHILLKIVQKQFAHKNSNLHLDIVFITTGLMKSYSELFLLDHYQINLNKLCRAIEEKVLIIAEHALISVITPDYILQTDLQSVVTMEKLLEQLNENIVEMAEDPLIEESLILLKEHLVQPSLKPVLIQGLLNTIRKNNRCKWVAYLYQEYLNSQIS